VKEMMSDINFILWMKSYLSQPREWNEMSWKLFSLLSITFDQILNDTLYFESQKRQTTKYLMKKIYKNLLMQKRKIYTKTKLQDEV
jgi:hypothetical protein